MLAQARKGATESVVFRRGSAERIPLKNGQADMAFMSQTWHHLRDPVRAARELQRVLAPEGLACIRNSTIENLGSYLYVRFFPGVRESYLRRMPRRETIITAMKQGGFRLVGYRAVRQEFAPSPRAYLGRIRQKAVSDLAELSDEEYALGFARLARHCRSRDPDQAVSEQIDFFAFRKP
jgi:SAM-dependent methyltransferase